VLKLGKVEEACPLGLAPSASTTAMMALGDALFLSVMKWRKFTARDSRSITRRGSSAAS
jgi:arabinose-5-phosphate isomerase